MLRQLFLCVLHCTTLLWITGRVVESQEKDDALQVSTSGYVPAGYSLFEQDEFDQPTLDESIWYPYRLPHWSDADHIAGSRTDVGIDYYLQDGKLTLTTASQSAWSPWDEDNTFATLMSGERAAAAGSKDGLHEFNSCKNEPNCRVYEAFSDIEELRVEIKHGYLELRAKFPASSRAAWWLIGSERVAWQSAEVDIFELDHSKPSSFDGRCVHFGLHTWDDPELNADNHYIGVNCTEFTSWHTYGLLWTPYEMTLFIDGIEKQTLPQVPNYGMLSVIDVGRWQGEAPNEIQLDYYRVYKLSALDDPLPTLLNGEVGWGHHPTLLFDGDLETYAQAFDNNWDLEVDLQNPYLIDTIRFIPDETNCAAIFSFQVRDQNNSWQTIMNTTASQCLAQTFVIQENIVTDAIRLLVDGEIGDYPHAIRELQIFGYPEYAYTALANMQEGQVGWGHQPAHATDGQFSTYAQSSTNNWNLELDLGQPRSLGIIEFVPDATNCARDLSIEVKLNSGDIWTPIHSFSNLDCQEWVHHLATPQLARYVRFDVTAERGESQVGHAIREVRLFEKGASLIPLTVTLWQLETGYVVSSYLLLGFLLSFCTLLAFLIQRKSAYTHKQREILKDGSYHSQ